MAKLSKALQAASVSGAAGLNVEEVFAPYAYEGNGSLRSITTNVDSITDGSLVWIKTRKVSRDNSLYDTVRGAGIKQVSNNPDADQPYFSNELTSFNTTGFTVSSSNFTNALGVDYASWTFKQQPKFFDIIEYTGDGNPSQQIAHNLGSVPGCMMVKCTSAPNHPWAVYHRSLGPTKWIQLDKFDPAYTDSTLWSNTAPTDTHFTVGSSTDVNGTGLTYIVYLFAHNDGDAEFGPTGDQDIIKCGTYTGNNILQDIDLGFEPQWLLVKNTTSNLVTTDWLIIDNIRGWTEDGTTWFLQPNEPDSESSVNLFNLKPTGFQPRTSNDKSNASGAGYIYIAIRRPMGSFDNVNDLFGMVNAVGGVADPVYLSNFPVDFAFRKDPALTENWYVGTRLSQGDTLFFNTTDGYTTDASNMFDHMDGWRDDNDNSPYQSWMFRRAKGFFDVISYEGDGQQQHDVTHNLGVVPEMMWIKLVTGTNNNWAVYHKDLDPTAPEDYYVRINGTNTVLGPSNSFWNSVKPTSTQITLGPGGVQNANGSTYVGYLFASIAGISKVGSYVGNGTSQNIDCGFSNGASFVLIRSASTTVNSNWILVDTRRGLNNEIFLSGNTPQVNNGEITSFAGGFALNNTNSANKNGNGTTYIFYAIAT